jgi:hypothetical protein
MTTIDPAELASASEPGAPRSTSWLLLAVCFVWGFVTGNNFGDVLPAHIRKWIAVDGAYPRFGAVTPAPVSVTPEERNGKLFFTKITPIDIKLRFVPASMIEAVHRGAYATTFPLRTPCEILMPADGINEIAGMTGQWPFARFLPQSVGDVLAHEILHCFRDDWHPDNVADIVKHG